MAWAEILKRVPGSRLLLKGAPLSDRATRESFGRRFAEQGIAPERVEAVAPTPDTARHLTLYGRVDVALDTFPYNGTTTTCEALWMGVPVVALRGNRHAARVGASILAAAGLDDWIAECVNDYIDRAVRTAGDLALLRDLRAGLRRMIAGSRLCDERAFARSVEAAFREIWRRWCADPAPSGAEASRKPAGP
jgi:protein O-GlcNAc transferase